MSSEATAIVLNHSRAKGTAKVVIIGIANHDGDGGAWPAIARLAGYANVDERTVQRAIATLVSLGEIRVHENAGGRTNTPAHLRPNVYEILLNCPPWCDRSRQHRDTRRAPRLTPLSIFTDPVTPVSPGDASVTPPVTPVSPHPVTPVSPELLQETNLQPSPALDRNAGAREKLRAVPVDKSAPYGRCPDGHPLGRWPSPDRGRLCDFGHYEVSA